jgi:hypothetical protein
VPRATVPREEGPRKEPTSAVAVAAASEAHRVTQIDLVESPLSVDDHAHEEFCIVPPLYIDTDEWLQGLLGDPAYTPRPPDRQNDDA